MNKEGTLSVSKQEFASSHAATMGDKIDGEQSLSNLFAEEADNDHLFADQSMAGSFSLVVVEQEHKQQVERENKQQRSSSTNNSLQGSKSISSLFRNLAWNGSCTSFKGAGEEYLHCSASTVDFEASNEVLGLTKKKSCIRNFATKYKHRTTTIQTNPSPMKKSKNTKSTREICMKQEPCPQLFENDAKDTTTNTNIFVADAVLTVDSTLSKEMKQPKCDDVEDDESALSESKPKPKRGLVRKDSCLFESGRNKLTKTTNSSRHLLCNDKEDLAPRCPIRCKSPTKVKRTRQLRLDDNV